MRWALLLFFLARAVAAQGCAASPEAAARAVIGSAPSPSGGSFRVADVQVDPVMKRVWMRVVRCDNTLLPAVLVPVAAPLQSAFDPASHALTDTGRPPAIHLGDEVSAVLTTSALRMVVEAVAAQSGAVGDVITLTLKRRAGQPADEPEHRIRGMVRADRTVEVQP